MKRIFLTFLLLISPTPVVAQVIADAHHELLDRVTAEFRQELISMFENDLTMEIRKFERHFDLKEDCVKRLETLANQIAVELQAGCDQEAFKKIIVRKMQGQNPETLCNINLNGRLIHFEEESKAGTPVPINVSVQQLQRIWISMPGGGSSVRMGVAFDVRDDKRWRAALSHLSDAQFENYFLSRDRQFQEQVLDLVVLVLTDELLLTDDQVQESREWMKSEVKGLVETRASPLSYARQILMSKPKNEKPEFLTDIQFNLFKRSQAGSWAN